MPSLGNFPAEYKLFKMTDSEIKYETKKIEHIDADKLVEVCKGYSKKRYRPYEGRFSAVHMEQVARRLF